MNRVVLGSVVIAALAGAAVLGWFEVRQARDFRLLLASGDAALANDDTSAAVEAFSGAIALRRESMLGWLKRGDTYRRRGDLNAALRDLEQAARLDPTALRPIELLGDVNGALGHHTRAIDYYSRIASLDDRSPRVLYKLGLAHYRAGRADAAAEYAAKALAVDRQLAEAYYLLGLCGRQAKRLDDAAAAFERALAVNPNFLAAREELASVDAARGRRRDNLEQLEAMAALEPARAERLIDVALAYARAGRPDAAVLTLTRAAERHPSSTSVYTALGRVWMDVAEDKDDVAAAKKAWRALEQALALDARADGTALLRGRAQLFADDAAAAERSLAAATRDLPVDPAAFRYLATAAERLGHRDIARDARARYEALAH
jgi:tetratricopeptide (TPR) repeat protein